MSVRKTAPISAAWRNALDASPELARAAQLVTGTRHGMADVFAYLFRAAPEFHEDGAPADWLVRDLQRQKGVEAVRASSALSVVGSLCALQAILDAARKQPQQGQREQRRAREELQQQQQQREQQQQQGDDKPDDKPDDNSAGAGDFDGDGENENESGGDGDGDGGGDPVNAGRPAPKEGDELGRLTGSQMAHIRAAAEAGREVEKACGMLAGSETAPLASSAESLQLAMRAADALLAGGTSRLTALLDSLGALVAMQDAERRRAPRGGPGVPVGIGRGGVDAATRATPDEALRLAGELGPELELDALGRALDGRLAVVDGGGESPSGLGPILLAIDRSGSMAGERQQAASALAMTLQRRAMVERRRFGYCLFDEVVVQSASTDERGRWKNPLDAVGVATWNANGGTDFTAPFQWFTQQLAKSTGTVPDCVLLTDGHSCLYHSVAEQFAALADERGARLVSLVLGWHGGWKSFAGQMREVATLTDDGFASPLPTAASMAEAVRDLATSGGPRRRTGGKLAAWRRLVARIKEEQRLAERAANRQMGAR